ncbi:MAG: fumarylacetoacetate hydrolase family protein [Muribaculaceae bacterium]|nr:fumarylacetoacetate hydrolase family protein [Muribaculaceae bacterium]
MKILAIDRPLDGRVVISDRVDLLADSSIVLNKKPLFLPDEGEGFMGSIHPAIRICHVGRSISPKFASRYYDSFTLVLRVTPPVDSAIPVGSAIGVSFDSALGIGEWIPAQSIESGDVTLTCDILDIPATFSYDSMKIDESIAMLSRYFTLKNGDIIIPSQSPLPSFPLHIDTRLGASVNSTQLLDFKIK